MILNTPLLKILSEFSSDYSREIYGRALAKKLGMNQKTVSNILKRLEKENILKFSSEGKNKYYFLNKFNPNISEIIRMTELGKKINFLEKHKTLKDLFREIEGRTSGICIVFGSYASGAENKESDIDLFVMGSIKNTSDIEKAFNIKINAISSKKKNIQEEPIFKEIMKNHIILKGVEEFTNYIKW